MTTKDHKEIEINGQKIAYYESAGKGCPVIFLHGNSMSSLSFARQLESPLGEKYRLVALDLPGHGNSAPAEDPQSFYSLPAYAEIVYKFAQLLELENGVLVGWSLGGHILLEAIGRWQEAAGLMLFAAPPVGKPMSAEAFIPHPLMPLLFTSDLKEEEVFTLTAAFLKSGSPVPQFFSQDLRRTDGRTREALGISIGEGNYADEIKVVANFNKPLAIVHGEKDQLVSLPYIKSLNIPTLWRGEVQIIPDAGHAPHWEQSSRFNHLLVEFIENLSGLKRS